MNRTIPTKALALIAVILGGTLVVICLNMDTRGVVIPEHNNHSSAHTVEDNVGDIGIGVNGKPGIGIGGGLQIDIDGELGISF